MIETCLLRERFKLHQYVSSFDLNETEQVWCGEPERKACQELTTRLVWAQHSEEPLQEWLIIYYVFYLHRISNFTNLLHIWWPTRHSLILAFAEISKLHMQILHLSISIWMFVFTPSLVYTYCNFRNKLHSESKNEILLKMFPRLKGTHEVYRKDEMWWQKSLMTLGKT